VLKDLNVDQARFIAILARTARVQRDEVLGNVAEQDLGQPSPARGEHNPTAMLGLEPLVSESPQTAALRDAIATLSAPARFELYALMRMGQGHLAKRKWHRGLVEASTMGDDTVTATMMEDADLHDHIAKGLFEADLAS
jgi:hypothetical protein